MNRNTLFFTALLFGTAVSAGAQRQIRNHMNPMGPQAQFGRAVTSIGDVDADGWIDYAISGPGVTFGGNGAGAVLAFSGRLGTLLWTAQGTGTWVPCGTSGGTTGDFFGDAMVLVPDADGDGLDDVAVGASFFGLPNGACRIASAGRLTVHSSVTGAVIPARTRTGSAGREFLGQNIARLQDVTFDGVDDYAYRRNATIEIIDGASGALWSVMPFPGSSRVFAGAGDFNGDGLSGEIAFGEPGSARVTVVDMYLGTSQIFSGPAGSGFGATIARDGNSILVGAPEEAGQSGAVYRCTQSGGAAQLAVGLPGDQLGRSIAVGGNADLDLVQDDILAGAPGGNAVLILDENGALVSRLTDPMASRLGDSVAWLGDGNVNGMTEILVGDLTLDGTAFVYFGGLDATLDPTFGVGCAPLGPAPTLTASGPLSMGTPVTFTMTGAAPFQLSALYFGRASTTGIVVPPCTLWMDPTFGPFQIGSAITSAVGGAVFAPFTAPVDPALIGFNVAVQAAVIDPNGFAATNAVSSVIGW